MKKNYRFIIKHLLKYLFFYLFVIAAVSRANNVIVVIIDGARYSETFAAEETNMPYIWNELRPSGTIFTNFYNDGTTKTNPGHATIVTGNWQSIANNGTERPTMPTVFEYFRQQTGAADSSAYVIAGADKLSAISYSTSTEYGPEFGSRSITNNYTGDLITYNNLMSVMDDNHPSLIVVNFKQVDKMGHAADWQGYLNAIKQVDSLIYRLWVRINDDPFYKDNTTLFVTNDHGRHDDEHGGFVSHGDDCEGCRHIMCLAVGKSVGKNQIVVEKTTQVDLLPTISDLLHISALYAAGNSFSKLISPNIRFKSLHAEGRDTYNLLTWEAQADTSFEGYIIKRSESDKGPFTEIAGYKSYQELLIAKDMLEDTLNIFFDENVSPGKKYWYKVVAVDSGHIECESDSVYAVPAGDKDLPSFLQGNIFAEKLTLKQNYPNPFNPITKIEFEISAESFVRLEIFNLLGKRITTLISRKLPAGYHEVKWNAEEYTSGTYIYRLRAGQNQLTKKMLFIR